MNYQSKAETAYRTVFQQFYVPEAHLFRENFPAQFGDRKYSYLWPYISMLSATNAMLSLPNPQQDYLPYLHRLLTNLEQYWQAPGYASYVVGDGSGQRFYDDNAWVGLELLTAYTILKDRALLDRAQAVFDFVVSGWSDDLGGGLYWREGDRTTKNTCSNGPAAVLGLQLYQLTGDRSYLEWAQRLYEWTRLHLRAPDGVYWDNLDSRGSLNRATYTYNTGIMIQAGVLLHQITRGAGYYLEALDLARRSLDHFAPGSGTSRFFPATPWFNAVLFRSYLALRADSGDGSFAGALLASLDYGGDVRGASGFCQPDWSGRKPGKTFARLLDQAPIAEIYALAAGLSDLATAGEPVELAVGQPGGQVMLAAEGLNAGQPALSPLGTSGYTWRLAGQGTYACGRYGSFKLSGAALAYYERLEGPRGPLGFPVAGPIAATPSSAHTYGFVLRCEGSQPYAPQITARLGRVRCGAGLYWSDRYGPHATHLAIGACYESFGGTGGVLGFPTSDRKTAAPSPRGTTGYYQRFEGGSIYESQAYGAHPVTGAIGACYESLHGTGGRIGFPVTDVTCDNRANGRAGTLRQRFEAGWISYQTGADAHAAYD